MGGRFLQGRRGCVTRNSSATHYRSKKKKDYFSNVLFCFNVKLSIQGLGHLKSELVLMNKSNLFYIVGDCCKRQYVFCPDGLRPQGLALKQTQKLMSEIGDYPSSPCANDPSPKQMNNALQ